MPEIIRAAKELGGGGWDPKRMVIEMKHHWGDQEKVQQGSCPGHRMKPFREGRGGKKKRA